MIRGLALVILTASLSHAPYQCARSNDAALRREETPAEALYQLASKLRRDGDEHGYRAALEFLIERYPSSRWAETARVDLRQPADGGG